MIGMETRSSSVTHTIHQVASHPVTPQMANFAKRLFTTVLDISFIVFSLGGMGFQGHRYGIITTNMAAVFEMNMCQPLMKNILAIRL